MFEQSFLYARKTCEEIYLIHKLFLFTCLGGEEHQKRNEEKR